MRPLGVTLVGAYQILRSVAGLVFALFILTYRGPANKFGAVAAKGNAMERIFRGLGHGAGVVVLIFVVMHFLCGRGLLRMKNWARLGTLLLSAAEIILLMRSAIRLNIFSLVFLGLNILCVLYLLIPSAGRAFSNVRSDL